MTRALSADSRRLTTLVIFQLPRCNTCHCIAALLSAQHNCGRITANDGCDWGVGLSIDHGGGRPTSAPRLPYVNNAKAVLITLAINLAAVLLLTRGGVTFSQVMVDAVTTAFVTTLINFLVIYPQLQRLREVGQLPQRVPANRLMLRLPRNPIIYGLLCATVFALVMLALNWLILTFFGISRMTLLPWLVYKLIFTTVISMKIAEFIIYRYVQPDWVATPFGSNATPIDPATVRKPFPKISLAKEVLASVTTNVLMNLVIGMLLGGVVFHADDSMTLMPTTIMGITIASIVFGLVTGALTSRAIIRGARKMIWAHGPDALSAAHRNNWLSRLPKRTIPLTIVTILLTMVVSLLVLPTILRIFNKPTMNFLQFSVLISIYAVLLSRPLGYFLTKRAMQRDFVQYTLDHYPAWHPG